MARVRRTQRLYLVQHTRLPFLHRDSDVTGVIGVRGVTGNPGADPDISVMGSGHLCCPPRLRETLKRTGSVPQSAKATRSQCEWSQDGDHHTRRTGEYP